MRVSAFRKYIETIANCWWTSDIDVIDICTPPALHVETILASHARRQACDLRKPFRLFRLCLDDPVPIGRRVAKSVMASESPQEMAR